MGSKKTVRSFSSLHSKLKGANVNAPALRSGNSIKIHPGDLVARKPRINARGIGAEMVITGAGEAGGDRDVLLVPQMELPGTICIKSTLHRASAVIITYNNQKTCA